MVSHHGERGTGLNHPPGDHDRVRLLWPEIYKIAQKNDCALRVTPCALPLLIAHFALESDQGFCVSVNIPNGVECLRQA